jgi:hypothetical protein
LLFLTGFLFFFFFFSFFFFSPPPPFPINTHTRAHEPHCTCERGSSFVGSFFLSWLSYHYPFLESSLRDTATPRVHRVPRGWRVVHRSIDSCRLQTYAMLARSCTGVQHEAARAETKLTRNQTNSKTNLKN